MIKLLFHVFGYARVRLDVLFDTRNGYTPSKRNKAFWEGEATVPWFRMEDIRANGRILDDSLQHVTRAAVKGGLLPAGSIIVSTSATVGEHALIRVPALANQRFTCLMLREEFRGLVDSKYLFYDCFRLDGFCRRHLNQGNFASVDMAQFGGFVFSLPAPARQREVAAILDRFDGLCSDLSEGLPAEIEARQRQYEYYRDRLLSFPVKVD